MLPIFVFFIFLNVTVALFAFGPWPWPVANPARLYTYLIANHVALVLGYLSAIRGAPGGYSWRTSPERLFRVGVIASLALTGLRLVARDVYDIGVLEGLSAPGDVYNRFTSAGAATASGAGLLTDYLETYGQMLFGPFTALVFPYAVLNWRNIAGRYRFASVMAVGGFIFTTVVMTGATKHLADLFLMTPWVVWLASRKWRMKAAATARRAIWIALLSTLAFASTATFFTATVTGRSTAYYSWTEDPLVGIQADLNHPLISSLPDTWQPGGLALIHYVVQGYYSLSWALDEPFVPCYGAGSSLFFMRYVEKVTGPDSVFDRTYVGRAAASWGQVGGLGRWHTIYTWMASDVTFLGAIVIVFLIGRVAAKSWLDCLTGANPFAVSLFLYLVVMVFYFSANNQVLQNSYQAMPFCLTFVLWRSSRRLTH